MMIKLACLVGEYYFPARLIPHFISSLNESALKRNDFVCARACLQTWVYRSDYGRDVWVDAQGECVVHRERESGE